MSLHYRHWNGFGESNTPYTRDESTLPAIIPNLHFKVLHQPRNYVQGSSLILHGQEPTQHLPRYLSTPDPAGAGDGGPRAPWPAGQTGRTLLGILARPILTPALQVGSRRHGDGLRILPASADAGRDVSFLFIYSRR